MTPKRQVPASARETITSLRELLKAEDADYAEMIEKSKAFAAEVLSYQQRQYKRKHDIAKARLLRFEQI